MGFSAILKRSQRASLSLAPWKNTEKRQLCINQEASPNMEAALVMILNFPAPRTVRNEYLLFISYSVYMLRYSGPNSLRQWLPDVASRLGSGDASLAQRSQK